MRRKWGARAGGAWMVSGRENDETVEKRGQRKTKELGKHQQVAIKGKDLGRRKSNEKVGMLKYLQKTVRQAGSRWMQATTKRGKKAEKHEDFQ